MRVRRSAPKFSVLSNGPGGLECIEVHVERPYVKNESALGLYYGEAFLPLHQSLMEKMKSRHNGVVLLEGPPGTGKTTYIRCCMHWLRRTHHFLTIPQQDLPRMWMSLSNLSPDDTIRQTTEGQDSISGLYWAA